MSQFLLAHPGKQHSYIVAKALFELNQLKEFHTGIGYSEYNKNKFYHLKGIKGFLDRRVIEGVPSENIKSHIDLEISELIWRYLIPNKSKEYNAIFNRDYKFDKRISGIISNNRYEKYWGFQGSSYHSLLKSKKEKLFSVYDMASIYQPEIVKILKENITKINSFLLPYMSLLSEYNFEMLKEEPLIADKIVVASSYSKQTLQNYHKDLDINIIPYGINTQEILQKSEADLNLFQSNRELKLLFVGRISVEKGIGHLLNAIDSIKNHNISITLIGELIDSNLIKSKNLKHFYYIPHLSKGELFKKYKDYDLLIFPTLYDGFGFVIIEAMAAGLPVIGSCYSAAPDIIENYTNGIIIDPLNKTQVIESIQYFQDLPKELYYKMSKAAISTSKFYQPVLYRNSIAEFLNV